MKSGHMEIIQEVFFRFLLNIWSILFQSRSSHLVIFPLSFQRIWLNKLSSEICRHGAVVPPCVQQLVITTACAAVESAVQNEPQQLHHYVVEASFMKTQFGTRAHLSECIFSIPGSH